MNLSFHRGDDAENVLENFRRIAALFDSTPDKIVCAKQTHTTNIRRVTKVDAGKGVTKEPDYEEIDGLITNEPGLILCTALFRRSKEAGNRTCPFRLAWYREPYGSKDD